MFSGPWFLSVRQRLTPRELDIVRHLAAGLTDQQVAAQLQLSVDQVAYSVRNALSKLGASNRPNLVLRAVGVGYLGVSPETLEPIAGQGVTTSSPQISALEAAQG